jgi:hypothetical protein
MIWVHDPRYLQAMYPDHEKLALPARVVTGLRLFAADFGQADSGRAAVLRRAGASREPAYC